MSILGNVPVVVIGNPKIKKNVEKQTEIKKGIVKTIFLGTHQILYTDVNAKNPERLDQKIQKKYVDEIGEKLLLHKQGKCRTN